MSAVRTMSRNEATDAGASWSSLGTPDYFTTGFSFVDAHTVFAGSDFGRIYDTDETALLASQLPDYGGGNTFAAAATNGVFGVCLQSLGGGASVALPWAVDGGTCTANDGDPWRAVPTTQTKVATMPAGSLGTATFVWGVGMRSGQQPGTYTAGVAFETVAPAS